MVSEISASTVYPAEISEHRAEQKHAETFHLQFFKETFHKKVEEGS